jgi:hypothetical protein
VFCVPALELLDVRKQETGGRRRREGRKREEKEKEGKEKKKKEKMENFPNLKIFEK